MGFRLYLLYLEEGKKNVVCHALKSVESRWVISGLRVITNSEESSDSNCSVSPHPKLH